MGLSGLVVALGLVVGLGLVVALGLLAARGLVMTLGLLVGLGLGLAVVVGTAEPITGAAMPIMPTATATTVNTGRATRCRGWRAHIVPPRPPYPVPVEVRRSG